MHFHGQSAVQHNGEQEKVSDEGNANKKIAMLRITCRVLAQSKSVWWQKLQKINILSPLMSRGAVKAQRVPRGHDGTLTAASLLARSA